VKRRTDIQSSPMCGLRICTMDNLPAENCILLGEGNANIVVTNPNWNGRVLRFSKVKLPDSSQLEAHRNILLSLLGSDFVPHVDWIHIDNAQDILSRIEPFRSPDRLNRSVFKSQPIQIMHNVAGHLEGFAVEIKPKWGFSPHLGPCRYCRHKNLKNVHTGYCPLDLYSGNPTRIHRAITCLQSHPANNLKLFLDGHPANSDEVKQSRWKDWIDLTTHLLYNTCLLTNLAQLQQQLHHTGIDEMIKIHKNNPKIVLDWTNYPQPDETRLLHDFSLSMTLKDVSIMIILHPKASIQILDLDIKPLDKLARQWTLHQQLDCTMGSGCSAE
jgi:hypothetical protein